MRMKKVLMLVMAACMVVLCAGTAVWADADEENLDGSFEDGALISEETLDTVARKMYSAKLSLAAESVKFPNINTGKPVEIYDGWAINTDRNVLLVFMYNNNAPRVFDGDNLVPQRDIFSKVTDSGIVYFSTYQMRKGKRYVVHKVSESDKIYGCYADCKGTLKSGKMLCAGSVDNNVTSYFKVKVSGNSLIHLELRGELYDTSQYKVKLFNSKKKAITKSWDELDLKNDSWYRSFFGVKKGTYYLGIRPVSNSSDALFDIRATVSKKKLNAGGKTKKKAKKIKVGQKIKQIFYCGKKNHFWYKVKISKPGIYYIDVIHNKLGWGGSDRTGYVWYTPSGCGKRTKNGAIKAKKGTLYIDYYNTKTNNGFQEFRVMRAS